MHNDADWETRHMGVFYLLAKYRFRFWTKDDIHRYQLQKMHEVVTYAHDHAPYFKTYPTDYTDITQIPITNKAMMMAHFSDDNTLGLRKETVLQFALEAEKNRDFSRILNGVTVGMSSGTSGNKGLILTTKREERYLRAVYLARLTLPKRLPLRIAFILRVSSPAFSYHTPWLSLTYVNQLQPLEGIVNHLNRLQPQVVAAPPSMLQILGQALTDGRLKITPKLLYSYAEVLDSHIQDRLNEAFQVPVYQIYQGSEGTYAFTCPAGKLHLNEDLVWFELYDPQGNVVPDGKAAYQTLVTDLHKRSQPIIRYELNDILTIDPVTCSCGSKFRVVKSIQGRANDLLWGKRNDNGKPQFVYQDYIKRAIITASEAIQDYQVVQHDYQSLEIRLVLAPRCDEKKIEHMITQNIETVFQAYACRLPKIIYTNTKPIPNTRSGKLIRVQSEIHHL